MKKILYVINYLTNGGPTRVLQNIIKPLDKNAYKITILTLINKNDEKLVKTLKKDGIEVIELELQKSLKSVILKKSKIIQKINEVNPNIIHTHGIVPTYLCYSKKIKCYKLTTIHNNMYEDYRFTYGNLKGKIFAKVHLHCLKRYNQVICCSKTSYNALKGKLKNATYILNGIDVLDSYTYNDRLSLREQLNIEENAIIYIYVGCLSKLKKVLQLLEMFDKYKKENEYLLVLGDGEYKKQCMRYQSKNIRILGFKENPLKYMNASDIYISNSSSEGFSISIIEALHCGLYCFLSNIDSHKECFSIDKNYYIGEYFDKNSFFEKKQKLRYNYENNKNIKKIKEFQDKYLSSKKMASEYEKYYKKVK